MALIRDEERPLLEAISLIDYCNPFLPLRIDLERQALGGEFVEEGCAWNMRGDTEQLGPNIVRICEKAESLIAELRQRLLEGVRGGDRELSLYEDLVIFVLYHRHHESLQGLIVEKAEVGLYQRFAEEARKLMGIRGVRFPGGESPEHLFAFLFQVRRAFFHIFHHIVGSSPAVARLRAAVWQSIFTHDARRYRRSLYGRMGDITTLITGPSGTGKELVARAIGLSRYIPFEAKTRRFSEDFSGSFNALNLSALSPTLIESELFGHRRGSFTGAIEERIGWLESCTPLGTVFLDEIGDLDALIQVKLLRVLQTRTFQRIGDTQTRQFRGKTIAATNRDLVKAMREGRFREDFYYRLCADQIVTPSLNEQLGHNAAELHQLVLFIARRLVPEEADALAREVTDWIGEHMPEDYGWPGNFRELEQCVRNVLIRNEYRPASVSDGRGVQEELARDVILGRVTAEELLRRYCTLIYAQTGTYEETARRLALDRRTVKGYVDLQLLGRLRGARGDCLLGTGG